MSVLSVNTSPAHHFSKEPQASIKLITDLGIEGDSHLGTTMQHLSRIKIKPAPPNLRQVHLLHAEFFEEVAQRGLTLTPGGIGENVTTQGIDLLGLGEGTLLHFVPADAADTNGRDHAIITVTGLRNPCPQIEKFQPGLQECCIVRDDERKIVERKSGIMATVKRGGLIKPGYKIIAERPETYIKLDVV
ncbi:MOSC domain-containing protein [Protomyces lactucae-debilis]|uniref:MOSC domain-containing protein n=1 Tax=Protomyces lactucae-debilis TaxID=2754530 RepID=A0A1Y2F0V9_PROLT|nr:MOSC domain-containing protein [Protomyces lactucae-debilis]ORY77347.1 MOSC domain-containing protein [Protomyces lactucae-debilis]